MVAPKGSDLPPAILDSTMTMLCNLCDEEDTPTFSYLCALIVVMASMDVNARKLLLAFMHSNPTITAGPDGVFVKIGNIGRSPSAIRPASDS